MSELLTPAQQVKEIKAEFVTEAEAFKRNRSSIEREMALNHINGLLDAYNIITVELCYSGEQAKPAETIA